MQWRTNWRRVARLLAIAVLLFALQPAGLAQEGGNRWLSRLRSLPGEHERSHRDVKSVFREVVQDANQSTVRVLYSGSQVALGTIVDAHGYVLTKASEIPGEVQCQLADDRRVDAKLVGVQSDFDLALLKLDATNLHCVTWTEAPTQLVGSWLATTSLSELPTAIGVVSASPRPLPQPRAILGIGMEVIGDRVRINQVYPGSAASKAGLKVGDFVSAVNGSNTPRPDLISAVVRQLRPGDPVTLQILRGEQNLSIPAILGDEARLGNEEQAELMDSLGGPLSNRRSGFPVVLEHDTVLRPKDCGGPVVDLDGKVVGINIARVSRVTSYALPAQALKPVLADLIAGKYPPPVLDAKLEVVSTASGGGE